MGVKYADTRNTIYVMLYILISLDIFTGKDIQIWIYVNVCIYTCMCVCVCACVHVCVHVCMHVYCINCIH